ncbi:hypothetical protein [Paenibacillus sp. Mc5Re-14]|uniref:hypothetical protein n=1 Tax=Paenibacillus sp. Mc5Re-14 TaxID=1030529 RepID=UPI000B14268E|nr:hypothetical protein [Paenibacillus sp. Mc5Re-14]
METLHFKVDPMAMIKIALQRYVEQEVEGKYYKAKQFACYDFLRDIEDNTLDEIVQTYAKKEGLSAITLENWRKDAKLIFDVICEREDYKILETDYKMKGFGRTKFGVYDKQANVFYDCAWLHHFDTILNIVEKEYPHMHDALTEMYLSSSLEEFDGHTRKEIESFIMNNFELCGGSKKIQDYL